MKLETKKYALENKLEQNDEDLMNEFFKYSGNIYICDAIAEIADSNISIYNSEILENAGNLYFSGAYEAAFEAGFTQGSNDLIKNLQAAWYEYNLKQLYSNFDALVYNYAINKLNKAGLHIPDSQLCSVGR